MTLTVETLQDVRFVKLNGVTRFIWMPRRGNESGVAYKDGILVLGFRGYCAVFAPFRPNGGK